MTNSLKTAAGMAALVIMGGVAGVVLAPRIGSLLGLDAATLHAVPPAAPAASAERKVLYWYDPMVPGQKFDKPGKSPFMDMQLVPRYADEAEPAADGAPALAVSTAAKQALGLRLATVEQRPVGQAVEVAGTLMLDERDVAVVQARTGGFVERVWPRAPGDVVAAGAPLAEVLNPEWLGAQQEYLAVRATGDAAMTKAARQRLVLLGMATGLIEEIERHGQPVALQTVSAPIGGIVSEWALRRGMALMPGATLARINGIATVWLEAALPEAQAALARPGQSAAARFAAWPGEVVQGRVVAVLPEINRESRTLRLRIELPNPGLRLRPGLYAQVTLQGTQRPALVVPAEGVIRTGKRAIVYVAEDDGRYRPVEVDVGEQVDDWLVVRSGLTAGQKIVASGQFLLDSEASLRGILARAQPAESAASMPVAMPMPVPMPASGASR